jgi:hypothetical protein
MRASHVAVPVLGMIVGVFACTPYSGAASASGEGDGGSVVSEQEGGAADASGVGSADASADASGSTDAGADGGPLPIVPIAFVQNVGAVHSDVSTSTLTLVVSNAVAAGDLLVARFAANAFSMSPTTITDAAGDTWHLDANISNGADGTNQVWSTRAAAGLTKGTNIVFSFSADVEPYTLVIDEFRGSELAWPALAADNAGVLHVGASATDATTDTLAFDVAARTHVLAIGVVFLQDDNNYKDNTSDGGAIWQPLTRDLVLNMLQGNLGTCGAFQIVGPKGQVTYAPNLGVSQNSVETIVLY